ncbi:MAG TPA: glycosyl transferase [Pseudolabrys sp.]|nr:glycosyl transferase [Pseudolabrys sp.]
MSSSPVVSPEASQIYAECLGSAVAQTLSIVDLINGAGRLAALGQKPLVAELYKTWLAHNGEHDAAHAAWFNYGVVLSELKDSAGAINAFQVAVKLKPDFNPGYINLGRALEDAGKAGAGVTQWLKLINNLAAVNGDSVAHKLTAFEQTGRVLEANYRDAAAEDALKQSLDINKHQDQVIQHWISLRQRQCKWPVIAPWDRVSRKDLQAGISSLSLANLGDDPMFQLARAYRYAKESVGMPQPVARKADTSRRDPLRLRIGYVSSDLREHAVGFAMTDVIEQHDHENFEIFAYYCGIKRTDGIQKRCMDAADHWTDINDMTDDQAAAKIAEDGVDILVDLNGYTKDARTKVFARRPAPIQVNWFGFPGTMATPYHHYIIADDIVIPPDQEMFYSEKVVRLPCYQPNDRKRRIAERRPTRAEVGLPVDAFVFCSLNGMQKITPRAFARWMTILREVPRSVLWMLGGVEDINARVRQLATEHGVAAERIIFADKLPNPDHLARYPLADLFLDSLPYGAHTTASDSLWMNVPILTLKGRTFAARVCADLLCAAGLSELVCTTADEYVARAIDFARNMDKLSAIKAKLAANRDTCLLFDTAGLVRNLEDLYRQMWGDLIRGALPVPDLRNLDIYHEIGVELDLENMDAIDDAAYLALYREKLEERHRSYPILPDARLWRDDKSAVSAVPLAGATAVRGSAASRPAERLKRQRQAG